MKVTFELQEKTFTNDNGTSIKYYVLSRNLIDGSKLEISVKGDKAKLLLMSIAIENKEK